MPIPLGIFATAGAGGGAAAGSFELISSTILTSTTTSVTISDIPQTYKHLQLRVSARGSLANTGSTALGLKINNSMNQYHGLYTAGSGVFSESNGYSYMAPPGLPLNNTTSGNFGAAIFDILDYTSTSKNKVARSLTGCVIALGSSAIALYSGLLVSTSAVTSVTFVEGTESAGFVAGSRFSLYGIKG